MKSYIPINYDKNDSLGVLSIGYEDRADRAHWGPGRRNYGILHYIIQGKGYYNGHLVEQNQGFYIPADSFQEYHADSAEPWTYVWITMTPQLAEKYVPNHITLDENHIFSYGAKDKMLEMFSLKLQKDRVLSHTDGLAFFFSLLSVPGEGGRDSILISQSHIASAKTYIDMHHNRKLTVAEVAEAVHIDDRYLYNLFMKYEGISPKAYITAKKLDTAVWLLDNTAMSVSQVAEDLGFEDVTVFSKFFKQKTGISPSNYRLFAGNGVDKTVQRCYIKEKIYRKERE